MRDHLGFQACISRSFAAPLDVSNPREVAAFCNLYTAAVLVLRGTVENPAPCPLSHHLTQRVRICGGFSDCLLLILTRFFSNLTTIKLHTLASPSIIHRGSEGISCSLPSQSPTASCRPSHVLPLYPSPFSKPDQGTISFRSSASESFSPALTTVPAGSSTRDPLLALSLPQSAPNIANRNLQTQPCLIL